jgi:hypothetical protein
VTSARRLVHRPAPSPGLLSVGAAKCAQITKIKFC